MNHSALYTLLLAILFAGCSTDSLDWDVSDNSFRVSFDVTLTDGYPQSQVKTRGTPQVGVAAYENEKITVLAYDQTSAFGAKKDFTAVLSKSGNNWLPDTVKSYDGVTYNFYAYASDLDKITNTRNNNGLSISSTTVGGNVPSISYIVPKDVTRQPDLLIGNKVENKASGKVPLSMYHALSCVGFVATSKHVGNIRKVKSVTLKKVYGEGTTTLAKASDSTIVWATFGEPNITFFAGMKNDEPLDENLDSISQNLSYLMNGDGYLMMIPQKLPEGAQVVMEIWDGQDSLSIHSIVYDIPPTTWEPGKKYMYYFDEPKFDGVATYYEKYSNNRMGLYYYDNEKLQNTLLDDQIIVDAGYGLLVPASTYTRYPSIYLGLENYDNDSKEKSNSDGSIAAVLSVYQNMECVLYPLSQERYPYSRTATSRRGLQPAYIEQAVKIESGVSKIGSGKPINTRGYLLPHYAKGIYLTANTPQSYVIRTPIQMRNISYQTNNTNGGLTTNKIYYQEAEILDFSIYNDRNVYGTDVNGSSFYKESIVIGGFGGTYSPTNNKAIIAGLIINTPADHNKHTALFEWVTFSGKISKVETAASCIYVCASTQTDLYISGIAAINNGTIEHTINRAAITANSSKGIRIAGIAGLNTHRIISCNNYGVINNQSNNLSSVTGGIVAWSEKYYSWKDVKDENIKNAFKKLQKENFSSDMEEKYPGALISTCNNYARVIGAARTGGIAGVNNFGGVVYNCTNSAEIRNNSKQTSQVIIGGIVGLQQCGLENNSTTNPDGDDPPKFFSTIQDCLNIGNVTATSGVLGNENLAVGGIVGYNDFARGTSGVSHPNDGYGIEAYGRVNQCVVKNARISGYYSDTGGIAGINSGNVNHSRCDKVYVGGVFGRGEGKQRNSAGGIVGTNNNYVGNCLFTHSYGIAFPISSAPMWSGSSSAGGIVGINNAPSQDLKSESGFVQKCIFAAIAPTNIPTGADIGTFAPIAGWTGGYLFRNWKNEPHLRKDITSIDATTGATPLYTIDDNYYVSGTEVNHTDGNISFPNEPTTDVVVGPFLSGRYPYGQIPLSLSEQDLIPLPGWFGSGWKSDIRPPVVPKWYDSPYSLPNASGTTYLLGTIVQAIKQRKESAQYGPVNLTLSGLSVSNTVRISLNYMSSEDLNYVEYIACDLSQIQFSSNNAGGTGSLFFRAPDGWKFDNSQTDPKPYKMTVTDKNANSIKTYYYCLVTATSGKKIKMIPPAVRKKIIKR